MPRKAECDGESPQRAGSACLVGIFVEFAEVRLAVLKVEVLFGPVGRLIFKRVFGAFLVDASVLASHDQLCH